MGSGHTHPMPSDQYVNGHPKQHTTTTHDTTDSSTHASRLLPPMLGTGFAGSYTKDVLEASASCGASVLKVPLGWMKYAVSTYSGNVSSVVQ